MVRLRHLARRPTVFWFCFGLPFVGLPCLVFFNHHSLSILKPFDCVIRSLLEWKNQKKIEKIEKRPNYNADLCIISIYITNYTLFKDRKKNCVNLFIESYTDTQWMQQPLPNGWGGWIILLRSVYVNKYDLNWKIQKWSEFVNRFTVLASIFTR